MTHAHTGHLKLRLHVSEPWDFERSTGRDELFGWTADHIDADAEEWELVLDEGFDFGDRRYARLLLSARYVGEHLNRVLDSIVGFPVRIAHRDGAGGWHYAFAGMLTLHREQEEEKH